MAMTLEEAANILNVSINATKREIKRAYRKLCMRWHPDKNPDNVETANKKMQLINSAYNLMYSQNPGRNTTPTTQTTQRASRPNTGHKTYYSNSQTHGHKHEYTYRHTYEQAYEDVYNHQYSHPDPEIQLIFQKVRDYLTQLKEKLAHAEQNVNDLFKKYLIAQYVVSEEERNGKEGTPEFQVKYDNFIKICKEYRKSITDKCNIDYEITLTEKIYSILSERDIRFVQLQSDIYKTWEDYKQLKIKHVQMEQQASAAFQKHWAASNAAAMEPKDSPNYQAKQDYSDKLLREYFQMVSAANKCNDEKIKKRETLDNLQQQFYSQRQHQRQH